MLSLVIETSTDRGCLALFEGQEERSKIRLPAGPQNAQSVLPQIEQLMTGQKISLADLKFLTVGVGPGSYTGMRVGAMVAKTLSYALKIPLVGISSLEGFIPTQSGQFAAIIDAKIGGAYYMIGEYQAEGSVVWKGQPALAELAELRQKLAEIDVLVVPAAYPLRDKLESASVKKWTWQETEPNLISMTQSALVKYGHGEYTTDGHLTLLYLRKTQAEIERDLKAT